MEILFEPVTLPNTLHYLLITIMLVIAGFQAYKLGVATGRLEIRKEQLDIRIKQDAELNAELKKLRGY
jgi:hypothetical protein